jgi:RNA polymerase sigma factor (sigma-70 family)
MQDDGGDSDTIVAIKVFEADDPIWGEVVVLAAVAAKQAHRMFRTWSDMDDLQQIASEHAFKRQDKVREYLCEDDGEGAWVRRIDRVTRRQGEAALITFMRRQCIRITRREKAKALGYLPEDEYYYSPVLVEGLIKVWGTGDYDLAGQVLDPASGGGKKRSKPANEGNDMLAMISDVGAGMESLDLRDFTVLMARYCEGQTLAQIADLLEISAQRVEQLSQRGVRKVIDYLGGRNPH